MPSAYILKSDGTRQELDHRPTLAEAQQIVDGYIEQVPIKGSRLTMIVNEEGLLKGLPLNPAATRLWRHSGIVGDVVVLEGWRTVG